MGADRDGYEPPEDCDDGDASVHPDAFEVPYDGVDQDCDGADLTDVDGDGYEAAEVGGPDCRDGNAEVHPDATEQCGGADEDCDDRVDEGCPGERDPNDPGGLSWTCSSVSAPGLWLGLLALFTARSRRWRPSGGGRPPGAPGPAPRG
jgi:hypothetical protein